jgi:GntR family transcriptional regulator
LYEQVQELLRSRIMAGEWELKEPLPPEAMLSRELGVSVGTLRKAMDRLARENIIVRQRGRGTFVKKASHWSTSSAFRYCERDGRPILPHIELLDSKVAIATEKEAFDLQIGARARGMPSVLRLHREWRSDDRLLCRETIVVEEARFPRLRPTMDEAAETLFAIYASRYRCKVERVEWTIGPQASAAAPILDGQSRAPDRLVLHRSAFDAAGVPLELCEQALMLEGCQVQICRQPA